MLSTNETVGVFHLLHCHTLKLDPHHALELGYGFYTSTSGQLSRGGSRTSDVVGLWVQTLAFTLGLPGVSTLLLGSIGAARLGFPAPLFTTNRLWLFFWPSPSRSSCAAFEVRTQESNGLQQLDSKAWGPR